MLEAWQDVIWWIKVVNKIGRKKYLEKLVDCLIDGMNYMYWRFELKLPVALHQSKF